MVGIAPVLQKSAAQVQSTRKSIEAILIDGRRRAVDEAQFCEDYTILNGEV